MTANRRPLLIFAVALLLPACLHVDATPCAPQTDQAAKPASTQTTDPIRKILFAELPSRPGVVVFTKPNAKDETTTVPPINPPPGTTVTVGGESPEFVGKAIPPNPMPDTPLMAAVRAHAEGRPDKAIEYLNALDKPNQELVLAVLPALARGAALDMIADPTATAILADQLRSAAARIEPWAALQLPVVALCESVEGFGTYDLRPRGKSYHPNDLAYLYIEVRNLVSQPRVVDQQGETYLTHARATFEIRDWHGKLVDQPNPDDRRRLVPFVQADKNVFTHTPVHDFYILYTFQVPREPGVYNVSVKIQDPATRRVVKTDPPIEFTVAGSVPSR